MSKPIQAIRGMNDITPQETVFWQYLENALYDLTRRYAYQEIRFPLLDKTELFKRAVGEVTDIVEKEMYTFEDRNGDSLTLRPEGTAPCVRAALEQGLLYNQTQRLWYMGPIFRHERPQKGRYRQFYQFGLEAFGMSGPDIDAEIILFTAELWKTLGLEKHLVLQLNSLGTQEERQAYRDALVAYLTPLENQLDEDSKRRLKKNPLRILDSKNPDMKTLIESAPKLADFLGEQSRQHFETLCKTLDASGVTYVLNPNLVRGLDYYSHAVFEWVSDALGAQATVCAGGRYDVLVELLGGKASPAVGFALGLERVIMLLHELDLFPESLNYHPDVYVVVSAEGTERVMSLVNDWRVALPQLSMLLNCGGGSFKAQFKRADKSGAKLALVLGEEELQQGEVTVKYLRVEKPQEKIALTDLVKFLSDQVSPS